MPDPTKVNKILLRMLVEEKDSILDASYEDGDEDTLGDETEDVDLDEEDDDEDEDNDKEEDDTEDEEDEELE